MDNSLKENLGCKRATLLLTELLNSGLDWSIDSLVPRDLPWGLPEHLSVEGNLVGKVVTAKRLTWLRDQNWTARLLQDWIILAPLVFARRSVLLPHNTRSYLARNP